MSQASATCLCVATCFATSSRAARIVQWRSVSKRPQRSFHVSRRGGYSEITFTNMSARAVCPVAVGWMQVKSNQFSLSGPR